jgi:hypothetical protein
MSSSSDSTTNLIKFIRHLKLEAVALAILMVVLLNESDKSLWLFPATFLLFDIGMIGYAKNPKLGARTYNATHSLVVPTMCIALGVFVDIESIRILGYLWTFHIATDRALGYGLKQHHSFHATHLGTIGKKR